MLNYKADLTPDNERPPALCQSCGAPTYAPPLCSRCMAERAVVRNMVHDGLTRLTVADLIGAVKCRAIAPHTALKLVEKL